MTLSILIFCKVSCISLSRSTSFLFKLTSNFKIKIWKFLPKFLLFFRRILVNSDCYYFILAVFLHIFLLIYKSCQYLFSGAESAAPASFSYVIYCICQINGFLLTFVLIFVVGKASVIRSGEKSRKVVWNDIKKNMISHTNAKVKTQKKRRSGKKTEKASTIQCTHTYWKNSSYEKEIFCLHNQTCLARMRAVVTCKNAASIFTAVLADVSRKGIPRLSA